MRVLHITSHLNVGGVARHTLSVAKALCARGHRVLIASGGGQLEDEARASGLTHWRAPLATSVEFSPQVFSASRRLAERLQKAPVDVIHAHTRVAQVVAEKLSRGLGIPYVTTWHGFFRPNLGRRLWPCTGEVTIAISEPVLQHLLRDFQVPAHRVRLILHGIDTGFFAAPVEASLQQELRDRLGVAPHGPVVGTIARLVASKGVDRLIHSLPQIRDAVPGTSLLIVGDGEERGRLEQAADACGVREAVRFAGTLLETRVALSLMQVFVFLPAQHEGFGLALLEAMASGRPIVAVRQGGGAPWVLDQASIVAVEPEDPRGLAAAVTRFLQDEGAARRAAEQARAVAQERYSIGRMVAEIEAVYREVARRERVASPSQGHVSRALP